MTAAKEYRYLFPLIEDDLSSKMVFIGGPRQVGKTTLAKAIAAAEKNALYLNWDNTDHRRSVLRSQFPPDTALIIFDELHKYSRWKSHIKGIWDTRTGGEKIIVTGSSRLDIYRKGGDSLLGRYHYYRLHPFSLAEIAARSAPKEFTSKPPILDFSAAAKGISELMRFGGFPEPFLASSERSLKRWQRERFERVFREDIRDAESVQLLGQIELLGALIPERVSSPLSAASLAEDIHTSPKTISSWLELLSRNYYIFRVPAWHGNLARALTKESKYYLWDWSEVTDPGQRFENMIASHLNKFCHYCHDAFGIQAELYFIRDREKREVDFLITWEKKPFLLAECKIGKPDSLRPLAYFGSRLSVENRFLVTLERSYYRDKQTGVHVIPADRFLTALV
ncbi:MAG: AAA family ATPase [Spirochaetota bacterium]